MPDTYDVFVSYAHADASAVAPIVGALRERGLNVWFDQNAIGTFAGITRSITEGIARSKVVVAFYSAIYPTRPACQWELTAAFLSAQRAGNPAERVLVVNPIQGVSHIEPTELRDAEFASLAVADPNNLDQLARKIEARAQAVAGALDEIQMLQTPRWFGNRSIGFTDFVGRLNDLWRLHSALHAVDFPIITHRVGSTVVQLRGLGGIGKTLLVQEYARRFGPAFPGGVFWLHAQGDEHTEMTAAQAEPIRLQQITAFARQLGQDTTGLTVDEVEGLLATHLEHRGQPYLWVVDGVPPDLSEPDLQRWFAPHPLGKTVFTTRSRQYEGLASPVDLGVLPTADALRLLTLYRSPVGRDEEDAAAAITTDLGGHALALHVAACWLRSAPETSIAQLRADLADPDDDELEFAAQLADTLPAGNTASIATTLKRSIDRLGAEAQDYLGLASQLAPAPIPGELAISALRVLHQLEPRQARRMAQLAQHECDRLSLSELIDERTGARSVHALVTRTVRFKERDSGRNELLKILAVGVVTKALLESGVGEMIPELAASSLTELSGPTAPSELSDQLVEEVVRARAASGERSYQHVELLATHGRELVREISRMEEVWLLKAVAIADLTIGAYHAAIAELTRLWLLVEALAGEQDPQTIGALIDLTKAMQKAGSRYAREFAEKALKAAVAALDDDSGITLEARSTLATSLKNDGELAAAIELDQQIVETKRRLLGPDDPSTIVASDNLAYTLHALALQQQDAELLSRAAQLHEENLRALLRILGPEDKRTLTARNNLAGTLVDQGKLAKAGELFQDVYETRRRVFGESHPDTVTALVSLARNAHELGDERGFGWLERALELARQVFGSQHPHTLVAIGVLAKWLRERNELDAARRLGEEVLQAYRQRFGEDHERTIEAISEFVLTLRAQGNQKAEQALLAELVEVRGRVLGIAHEETLSLMRTLAASYYNTGDYRGSAQVEKRIHEALAQSRGEADPTTLAALSDLASSHYALGLLDDAQRMTQRVVELRAETLGPTHPHTVEARYNLFGMLFQSGKREAAAPIIAEVMENLATMKRTALEELERGEQASARAQLEELVDLCRRIMGETEDRTLDAMGSLVGLLLRVGEQRDALPWILRLVEAGKKLHGEDDPHTRVFINLYMNTLAQVAKQFDLTPSS